MEGKHEGIHDAVTATCVHGACFAIHILTAVAQSTGIVIAPAEVTAGSWYGGKFGYTYEGKGAHLTDGDTNQNARISKLILLENGKPLGPPHSPHSEVEKLGEGRFSHWSDGKKRYVRFSTSDNSDPRTNGRKYTVAVGK